MFIFLFLFYFKVYGTTDVPFKDVPLLTVHLPDSVPSAFNLVLNYIYTDKIDPTKNG